MRARITSSFANRGEIMPHYHFDLIDTTTIADQGGSEVHDDLKAMDVAEELARRLVIDRPDLKECNYSILVSNEDGGKLFAEKRHAITEPEFVRQHRFVAVDVGLEGGEIELVTVHMTAALSSWRCDFTS